MSRLLVEYNNLQYLPAEEPWPSKLDREMLSTIDSQSSGTVNSKKVTSLIAKHDRALEEKGILIEEMQNVLRYFLKTGKYHYSRNSGAEKHSYKLARLT